MCVMMPNQQLAGSTIVALDEDAYLQGDRVFVTTTAVLLPLQKVDAKHHEINAVSRATQEQDWKSHTVARCACRTPMRRRKIASVFDLGAFALGWLSLENAIN